METEETKPAQTFIEGEYVRVYGIIKSLQGQKNVQAFKILPIKDLNEITNHMLESMHASIYYFAKANGESLDGMSFAGAGAAAQQPFGHHAAAGAKHSDSMPSSHGGLNDFQFKVFVDRKNIVWCVNVLV